MPRPIETLLSLPRVRLIDRVPILETEEYIRRFMNRQDYRPRLLKHAFSVSRGSAKQFSTDDQGLQVLLERLGSEQYIVTKRSERVMEEMLSGICEDGAIYKEFEEEIEPLCDLSARLREMSKLADSLADKTKEESIDVARALTIRLPTRPTNN